MESIPVFGKPRVLPRLVCNVSIMLINSGEYSVRWNYMKVEKLCVVINEQTVNLYIYSVIQVNLKLFVFSENALV